MSLTAIAFVLFFLVITTLAVARGPATVTEVADADPVVVDLTSAENMPPEQAQTLDRYLAAIQVMRRDAAGPTLSVRQSDLKVLAALLDTANPVEALERLAKEER